MAEGFNIIKKHGWRTIGVATSNGYKEGRTLVILRLKTKKSSHLAKQLQGSGYSANSRKEPEAHL